MQRHITDVLAATGFVMAFLLLCAALEPEGPGQRVAQAQAEPAAAGAVQQGDPSKGEAATQEVCHVRVR